MYRLLIIFILIITCTISKAQVNHGYIQIQLNLEDKSDSIILGLNTSKLIEEINRKSKKYYSDSIIINELMAFHQADTLQYFSYSEGFSMLYSYIDSLPDIESVDECIYTLVRKGDANMNWISSGKEIINFKTKKQMIRDKGGNRYSKIREYIDKETGKYLFYEGLVFYGDF